MTSERQGDRLHKITLDNRKGLTVTGVLDVDSCDGSTVTAQTVCGLLTVEGENLHVKRLSLEDGVLDVEGTVGALYYQENTEDKKSGFFARLFR
ncbi:MAG: sporulation protein YabP [Clostridia bacterium]|nr:sporulation protein YabP [Clostridia bacterium]